MSRNVPKLGQHGGARQRGQGQSSERTLRRGETTEYLTARLARDRPDLLERLKAGEFTSVRQAAVEAGIVRPKTRADQIRALWRQLSASERRRLFIELLDSAIPPERAMRRYKASRRKPLSMSDEVREGKRLFINDLLGIDTTDDD